jgi:nucleoside recognition membrane protein YjiH
MTNMITTTVEAMASFLEGQVTFFSSTFTSPRNWTAFVQIAGPLLRPVGLMALGNSFFGIGFGSALPSAASPATASLCRATACSSCILSAFLRPFFLGAVGLFRLRRPIGFLLLSGPGSAKPRRPRGNRTHGRPGGIRTPITRIWSPVL